MTLRSTLALDLTHNIGRQTRAPNTTSTHSNDELITLFETIRLGGVQRAKKNALSSPSVTPRDR